MLPTVALNWEDATDSGNQSSYENECDPDDDEENELTAVCESIQGTY